MLKGTLSPREHEVLTAELHAISSEWSALFQDYLAVCREYQAAIIASHW